MLSPIESNLSVFNVDTMANHIKDPNATHAQGVQQMNAQEESEEFSQTVRAADEAEGDVRVGEKERERRERERKRKKRAEQDVEAAPAEDIDRTPDTSRGFSFIA